ncbi:MAG: acyltransferase [Burkholderiaceae bacterium]|nr:acyltransferase [Burkholderiaceae bacterium]
MTSSRRFETLDAMRGLAALFVVFRHTTVFGTAAADSHSYLAVDLFFVLSGFVIAHAYERPLLERTMGFGRFVAVRLIRLYPLLLVSVAFAAAVALTAPPYDAASASRWDPVSPGAGSILGGSTLALLFLPSHIGGSPLLFPLNTALWSLMYELAVNVLYAAWGVRRSTRTFAAVVAACGLAVAALVLHREGMDWGWSWGAGSILPGLLRAGFGFGAGVLLHRFVAARPARGAGLQPMPVLALAMLPLLVPDLPFGDGWVDVVAVGLVFPVAIVLGASAPPTARLLPVFLMLGAASYPVYVLHVPALKLMERALGAGGAAGGPLEALHALAGAAFVVALVACALALDRWYDRPLRGALTGLLRRRGTLRAAV